jgi:hypothetical protein
MDMGVGLFVMRMQREVAEEVIREARVYSIVPSQYSPRLRED